MASDSPTTQSGATAGLPSSVLSTPPIIHDLVAKFTEYRETYKRGDYNETMLRRDFLDPFFAAMDRQIDQLVYEPNGLTDEEIALVEEATGNKR
jgi:hypothetical protein